jgi:hypothetical protein
MIIRIWNGTTTVGNAVQYEQLLKDVIFPRIRSMRVQGYRGIQLLKNATDSQVDFVTIMGFDTLNDVKNFAGDDYEKSYVIEEAKVLLKTYDAFAKHFEMIENTLDLQP